MEPHVASRLRLYILFLGLSCHVGTTSATKATKNRQITCVGLSQSLGNGIMGARRLRHLVARNRHHAFSTNAFKIPDLFNGIQQQLQPQERKKLGKLSVSPMGIGTWAWGNRLIWGYDENMDEDLKEVFDLCVSKGVNLFDTGDSYGTGALEAQSEKLLGRFISELPEGKRNDIHVATKLATYPWRITPGQLVSAAEASKARTQGSLSVGQLHWPASNYAPWQEKALWDGLVKMRNDGVVKEVGVSNYGPKNIRKIQRYLEDEGIQLASNQVQYSLLSRRDDCKEANDEAGVLTIAYSPLCLGLLTGRYDETNLPRSFVRRQLFKDLLPKTQPLLQELREVANAKGKTMSQVSINWCMAKGCVPIPGAKNRAQAVENLGALGWKLSSSEVEALDAAASKCKATAVQNIFMNS